MAEAQNYYCHVTWNVGINPCDSNPCANNGSCIPGMARPLDYTCQCAAGYTGPSCEANIDDCQSVSAQSTARVWMELMLTSVFVIILVLSWMQIDVFRWKFKVSQLSCKICLPLEAIAC